MQFKQYLKITLADGDPFHPSHEGFPQLYGKGPFSHIIWEEGTTDFWFVDNKGVATYTPNLWTTPSNCFYWISSGEWLTEPMNPRFEHSDPYFTKEWEGYLELIDEQIWHIHYNPNKAPILCGSISMSNVERFVSQGIWKQVPPTQSSPTNQPKPEHIPARKPVLEDIFHTL